ARGLVLGAGPGRGRRVRWGAVVAACGVLVMFAARPPGALASAKANWGAGVEAVLPTGAASNPNAFFDSVSCASAGDCAAAGDYLISSGCRRGVLRTEASGGWAAGVEAGVPANAYIYGDDHLTSVSCGSAGSCSAVGDYTDSSGSHQQVVLLRESAGTWATGVE